MRVYTKMGLAVLFAIAFVVPAWAAHKISASITLGNTATIGTTTLKPGNYRVVADPNTNQLQLLQCGHVLATTNVKWVDLKKKSPYTAVVMDKDQIREIDFSGKLQAIRLE